MTAAAPRIVPLGETAWTVVVGDTVDRTLHRRVLDLAGRIEAAALPGVLEVVPAYCALSVFFDPRCTDSSAVRAALTELAAPPARTPFPPPSHLPGRLITIPVTYAGPDLDEVCARTSLTRDDVIQRHSSREYFVYLLGFVPGFAYLGDLDPALVLPRRSTPRTRVPAGSVAIAGAQTAVYPLTTPGGWHLIGHTELRLFDPGRNPAALLNAGDRVRFEPVS